MTSRKALIASIVDEELTTVRQRMRERHAAELASRADAAAAEARKAFWSSADHGALDREWRALQRRVRNGIVALVVVAGFAVPASAQVYRTPTTGGTTFCTDVIDCLPAPLPGPQGPRGVKGEPGERGPEGPAYRPPVCPAIPPIDLPLTTPTWLETPDCGAYLVGYLGTTAYLVDVRGRRYQALPAPLSGHVMLGTQASRTDPWTLLAWDATGTWVVRVTPGTWTVLP